MRAQAHRADRLGFCQRASCLPPPDSGARRPTQGRSGAGEPDAEARAAAVRALVAVARELCLTPRPVAGGAATEAAKKSSAAAQPADAGAAAPAAAAPPAPAAAAGAAAGGAAEPVTLGDVLPVLLGAMGDYATDARGDVGSWVRGRPALPCAHCGPAEPGGAGVLACAAHGMGAGAMHGYPISRGCWRARQRMLDRLFCSGSGVSDRRVAASRPMAAKPSLARRRRHAGLPWGPGPCTGRLP